MKVTLRQVESECRSLNNGVLLGTPWGVQAERCGTEVVLWQVPRKMGSARAEVFRGGPREVMVFLAGIITGLALAPLPFG